MNKIISNKMKNIQGGECHTRETVNNLISREAIFEMTFSNFKLLRDLSFTRNIIDSQFQCTF